MAKSSKNSKLKLGNINSDTKPYQNLKHKFKFTACPELNKTVIELFAQQVQSNPNKIALKHNDEILTYTQLDKKSSRLAQHLRQQYSLFYGKPLAPDTIIGFCFARGINPIISALAIVKAGGAYLPIDPAYPSERVAYMLTNSSAAILLSDEKTLAKLPAVKQQQLPTIQLDQDWTEISNPSHHQLEVINKSSDLIYVMYTSGSTGKPKGVMVEQHSVIRVVKDTNFVQVRHDDKIAQVTNLAFDPTTFEIWGALLNGLELHIFDLESVLDTQLFARKLENDSITIMILATGIFNLHATCNPAAFKHMRYLMVGGEALSPQLAYQVLNCPQGKPQHLLDVYGPTEATLFTSTYDVITEKPAGEAIPIGTPISETTCYILDDKGNQVENGQTGELYVGGIGVARGYINNDRLTSERFIIATDEHGEEIRLYKTGDHVCVDKDKNICFIGRVDFQVKLRGHRIELSEIDNTLEQLPTCAQAITLFLGKIDNKKLITFYTAKPQQAIKKEQLKSIAENKLPKYMQPDQLIELDNFPINHNGKVDREKLAGMFNTRQLKEKSKAGDAPKTLLAIAQEITDSNALRMHDDFFLAGGNSLQAARLVNAINTEMNINCRLSDIFSYPRLSDLEKYLQRLKKQTAEIWPLTKQPANVDPVLSMAQQRMFFLAQSTEFASSRYNVAYAILIKGHLNIAALEQALNQILTKQDSLHTTFSYQEGKLLPIQQPTKKIILTPKKITKENLENYLQEASARIFDLTKGPLFHVELLQLKADKYVLFFNMHHIITDGWSLKILLEEINSFYLNPTSKKTLTQDSEQAIIPYSDYAYSEQCWEQSGNFTQQLNYWKHKLTSLERLNLPKDKSTTTNPLECGCEYFFFSHTLSEKIKAVAQSTQTTPYMVLLAALNILLYRYSHQKDIVVGTPTNNRPNPKLEKTIGLFVNTLVLRNDLRGDPNFKQILQRVKTTCLDAFENQNIPFNKVIEALKIEHYDDNPIFEVMFVLQNAHTLAQLSLEDVECEEIIIKEKQAKFPITFEFTEIEGNYLLAIKYRTALFESDSITRMARQLQQILKRRLDDMQAPLSEALYLFTEEALSLVNSHNNKRRLFPISSSIQAELETIVEKFPQNIALSYDNISISYQALNQTANQLARHLQQCYKKTTGQEPAKGALIAICCERSIDMIVSALAILKAGCAYLPIDPSNPQERIEFILADSQAKLILTHKQVNDELLDLFAKKKTIFVDDNTTLKKQSSENLAINSLPNDLAYVIYTSGSTGKPKGVMVEHGNLLRLLKSTHNDFKFNQHDVWTLFHSFAFDFSIWETWGALLHGSHLVIVPYLTSRDPEKFHRLLKSERVTILNQTPAAFKLLAHIDSKTKFKIDSLHCVIFGGEALNFSDLTNWTIHHPLDQVRLVNMYGITETTVHTTYHEIQPYDFEMLNLGSNIGRPLIDLKIYILDETLHLCADGIIGEIHIAGPGVTRGYLNQPELTQERYIANPYSQEKEYSRLYRSGDLGYWTRNGQLFYAGRKDFQVKIRGFRIELGEIQQTLLEIQTITQACVIAYNNALIAYIVTDTDREQFDQKTLLATLKQKLPNYMLPSEFILLDRLPLTANGKVDTKSLPKAGTVKPLHDRSIIPPQNKREKVLLSVWQHILKREDISTDDSFFDIGGDSLLSVKMQASLLHEGYGFKLQALFKAVSIKELAHLLHPVDKQASQTIDPFALVNKQDKEKLKFKNLEDAYPAAQQQLALLYHSEQDSDLAMYQEVLGLTINLSLDEQSVKETIHSIVSRHEIFRTAFDLANFSEPLQLVYAQAKIPIKFFDISSKPTAEQQTYLDKWKQTERKIGFDFTSAPLARIYIHYLAKDQFHLTFSCHHAIIDGWSDSQFVSEFVKIYNAKLNKQNYELEPLQSKYRDYIACELTAIRNLQTRAFWKERIASFDYQALHKSDTHPPKSQRGFKTLEYKLPIEEYQKLKNIAQQAQTTLKDVLIAAQLKALSLFMNTEYVACGITSHGRLASTDGDQMLGLFLNVLPISISISNCSWLNLIRSVNEEQQAMYEHRYFPTSEISKLADNRPLFDLFFNYTNFHSYDTLISEIGNIFNLDKLEPNGIDFPLVINANLQQDNHINLYISYRIDQLSAEFVQRFINYLLRIIQEICTDPQQSHICDRLIIPADQKLLTTINATETPPLCEIPLDQLITKVANQIPEKTAIVDGARSMTYSELECQANKIAFFLKKELNQQKNPLIAFCMQPSIEAYLTMFAILKADAAYVPLGLHDAKERHEYILEDTQAALLISDDETLASKTWLKKAKLSLYTISSIKDKIANNTQEYDTLSSSDLESIAYVCYTSGSTGRPKGVQIEHHSIVRRIRHSNIHINENSRVTQGTNIAFDASFFEIWGTFINGATLYVLDKNIMLDNQHLKEFITRHSINFLSLPTGVFNQHALVEPTIFSNLEVLFTGGDLMSIDAANNIMHHCQQPPHHFYNLYGPTETTICATGYQITHPLSPEGSVPIGKPLENTQCYVYSILGQRLPIGAIGELYISGDCVARGYLNKPEQTRENFIHREFIDNKHRTKLIALYRTGDLVRVLADGNIEFQGRQDNQVKIRGYRVELEDVKTVIRQLPEIEQVFVIYQSHDSGGALIAYYTLVSDQKITIDTIKNRISTKLAAYMIPDHFIELKAFPLTSNGKLDKKSLPKPSQTKISDQRKLVPPKTYLEKRLYTIWQETLNIGDFSINDSFYSIGGNSLSSIRMLALVKKQFKVNIDYAIFSSAITIKTLANVIQQLQEGKQISVKVPQLALDDSKLSITQNQPLIYPKKINLCNIVLTGVTGFLGIHLLSVLHKTTQATIYCIIRAKDLATAQAKLKQNLNKFGFTSVLNDQRIKIFLGDLQETSLGLSEKDQTFIKNEVDAIYHNAAFVNHLYDYATLRTANVLSTLELAKLSAQGHPKYLHFISTISTVLGDKPAANQAPPENCMTNNGYVLTKWVAEHILQNCAAKGLRITIHRPGNITGQSQTGITNPESNHALLLLKSAIELGVFPAWKGGIEMMPVDILAEAIIKLSMQPNESINYYNLANPNQLDWHTYINLLNQEDYDIQLIDPQKWRNDYISNLNENNALYPLRELYMTPTGNEETTVDIQPYSVKTQHILNTLGTAFPNDYQSLIPIYTDYLKKLGFLNSKSK